MRKLLTRAAVAAACTLGLTVGLASPAQATTVMILPGCWGALGAAICDVAVVVNYDGDSPVYMYTWQVETCTGTCSYTTLPFVWLSGQSPDVHDFCVSYRNRYDYYPVEQCAV